MEQIVHLVLVAYCVSDAPERRGITRPVGQRHVVIRPVGNQTAMEKSTISTRKTIVEVELLDARRRRARDVKYTDSVHI